MSEHGLSDSGSTSAKERIPSSSSFPSLKVFHEGEIPVLNANSNEDDEGETKEQTEKGGFSSSQSIEVSQANKDCSLNEQDNINSKINEVASRSLELAKEDERVSDPLGPLGVDAKKKDGSNDTLKLFTTFNSHAYEDGISSSDDVNKGHAHDQPIPKFRRSLRNFFDKSKGKEKEDVAVHYKRSEVQNGSLSESSDGTDDSDVFKIFNELSKEIVSKYQRVGPDRSFDSMEYQSAKGCLELEKDEYSRSMTGSSLVSDEDLIMKIDELRDALSKFVQRKDTKFSHRSRYDMYHLDQQPKASLLHHARGVSYGQTSNTSEHSSLIPFSGPAPCSCLHCQEERRKQFRFTASVGSNSSPGGSLHLSEKSFVKEKPKRHYRPISQAAPFVICYNCKTLLQLPADFLISRKKLHKLKCDACKEVLMLTFPERAHSIPSSDKAGKIKGSSATLSEEKGKGPSQLHRLKGYGSARELLYSRKYTDEGFDFSVSPSLPVNDKAQRSGSSTP